MAVQGMIIVSRKPICVMFLCFSGWGRKYFQLSEAAKRPASRSVKKIQVVQVKLTLTSSEVFSFSDYPYQMEKS